MSSTVPIGDPLEASLIEDIVEDPNLNEQEVQEKLNATLKDRASKRKQSSFRTIFNVANTMMGSALLVMPIKFYISGMISALIAALIMAVISYVTCNLVIIHSKDEEIDYPEAILRILGRPWQVAFNIMSMILLYLVGLIHFVLMSLTFYSICKNIFPDSDQWAKSDQIAFDKFSMQYVGFIMFGFCAILFSFRNLKSILAINDKGLYMIMIFCVFIVYLGFDSIARNEITFTLTGTPGAKNKGLELVMFTGDLPNLVGIFALAYMIHNSVAGMMKNNRFSEKNSRDLGIAYLLVFMFYSVLGIIGMFAVAGLYNGVWTETVPSTLMDLLVKSNPYLSKFQYIMGSISLGLIFTQLSTVIPILCFFTRRQFFDLIYGPRKRIPNLYFHLFNFGFNLSCLLVEMLVWEINLILGFSGAVGGFMLIYIIPIYLHMKCVYFNNESGASVGSILPRDEVSEDLTPKAEFIRKPIEKCRDHDDILIKSKNVAWIVYGGLLVVGVAILFASFYDIFK